MALVQPIGKDQWKIDHGHIFPFLTWFAGHGRYSCSILSIPLLWIPEQCILDRGCRRMAVIAQVLVKLWPPKEVDGQVVAFFYYFRPAITILHGHKSKLSIFYWPQYIYTLVWEVWWRDRKRNSSHCHFWFYFIFYFHFLWHFPSHTTLAVLRILPLLFSILVLISRPFMNVCFVWAGDIFSQSYWLY